MAIQLPLGAEDKFEGVIDLVEMRAIRYRDESLGAEYVVDEIPAAYAELAHEYREKLVEKATEASDALLEKYLGGEAMAADELRAALRRRTIASVRDEKAPLVPVLCGSAFRNKGVQPLLDAVVDYLPAPTDIPPVTGLDPKRPTPTTSSARPTTRRRSPRWSSRS